MKIETALAKAALDVVSRRDPNKIYHKLSVAELQALTPQFQWQRYFTGIGAPPIYALNVTEPDFFKAMGQALASTPIDEIKSYLRWHVAHASAAVLSAPFVDENFRFYGTQLTGAKELRPRWKRCVQYTDDDLGEALGQAFVKEAFGPQAKADTLKMVHELEAALETDIHGLAWMTEATKKEALVKLHAITEKIGYPERWRDYSALNIVRGDALGNSQRSNAFEFRRQLSKIGIARLGEPVDDPNGAPPRRRAGRRSAPSPSPAGRAAPRQSQHAAGGGEQPALDLGDAEAGVAGGHDQVGRRAPARSRRPAPSPRPRRSAA